jgi:hypothetical protein
MEQLILLLQERNHYLEKFYDINDGKIGQLASGDLTELEEFYNEREHVLGMIRHIDKVIEKEQKTALNDRVLPGDRQLIQSLLDSKDDLVKQILAQDLQILSIIETEKSTLIRELSTASRGRKAMNSYKYQAGTDTSSEEGA